MPLPTWLDTIRDFASFRTRWGLRTRISGVWSGVLPTVQLERHYDDNLTDQFGASTATAVGSPTGFHAISLFNDSTDREYLVWNACGYVIAPSIPPFSIQNSVHFFTPLEAYDPFSSTLDRVDFPWLETGYQRPAIARIGTGQLLAGSALLQQQVTIASVLFTTIGPTHRIPATFGGGTLNLTYSQEANWLYRNAHPQQPPLRIKPGEQLCCQSLTTLGIAGLNHLEGFFIWSERPFARGAGT